MAMLNAFSDASAKLDASTRALVERREAILGPAYRLFYEEPVHFVRGSGVWLFDVQGTPYLDAYNNVASLGHCHPRVVAALADQAGRLNTHTRYLSEDILDYAQELLATLGGGVERMMFTCTGSEANDLALRVARSHTGGTGIIVTELAYHGVTAAVAACSPSLGPRVAPEAHVRTIAPPDSYTNTGDIAGRFTADVAAAIESLRRCGIRPAALLIDSLFTSDGIFSDPPDAVNGGAKLAQQEGLLLIADEVQAGFGRTGSHMWGFARRDLNPDIVTMGKPMGNGHPVAAVAARAQVLDRFGETTRYFNTFGGNSVSCAVAHEVLRVLREEDLMANAVSVGHYFKELLLGLHAEYECIGDVRGAGLFLGVELVRNRSTRTPAAEAASYVVNEMRRRRILISASGPRGNVLKIRPPLVFTRQHVNQFIETLASVLRTMPLHNAAP